MINGIKSIIENTTFEPIKEIISSYRNFVYTILYWVIMVSIFFWAFGWLVLLIEKLSEYFCEVNISRGRILVNNEKD